MLVVRARYRVCYASLPFFGLIFDFYTSPTVTFKAMLTDIDIAHIRES